MYSSEFATLISSFLSSSESLFLGAVKGPCLLSMGSFFQLLKVLKSISRSLQETLTRQPLVLASSTSSTTRVLSGPSTRRPRRCPRSRGFFLEGSLLQSIQRGQRLSFLD